MTINEIMAETEVIYDITSAEIDAAYETWNSTYFDNNNLLKETVHPV